MMKMRILFRLAIVLFLVLTSAGSAISATGDILEMTISEDGTATVSPSGIVPPFTEACDCGRTDITGIPQTECEALVALYHSTNGANWKNNTNWNTKSACDSWFGVELRKTPFPSITLPRNALGTVESVILPYNGLTGSIPAELGNLSNLDSLCLSGNPLTGSIPAALGNLANLRILTLSHCNLSGSIPAELGNLANLFAISLSINNLTGPIPAELGNLSTLTRLGLNNNRLTGSIPIELGNLSDLIDLHFENNRLTGSIPIELGNLFNLLGLILHNNQLSGPIPAELGNLVDLDTIDLCNNNLLGSVPTELGNLSNLVELNLNNNQLSGAIPAELGNLSNLRILNLGFNRFSGTIPNELGNLDLNILFLWANQLEGDIPASLANMAALYPMTTGGMTSLPNFMALFPTSLFAWNMLTASDPSLLAFLDTKTPSWAETQTIPPEDLGVSDISQRSVRLTWMPISYTGDGGFYRISYATSPDGPFTEAGATVDKHASEYIVTNLAPRTNYYFMVETITPAHVTAQPNGFQKNALTSNPSEKVSAFTHDGTIDGGIRIMDIGGKCGEYVIVPVSIQNAPNAVVSMGFDVVFDPEIFTYKRFEQGPVVPDAYAFEANFIPPNIVRIGSHKNGSLTTIPQGAAGDIVRLKFKVARDCHSSQFELNSLKDDIAGWSSSSGFFVKQSENCKGDINDDGELTPADALAAFEKYMLICPTSRGMDCIAVCGDVNDDGNCTPADALCVFNAYLGRPNCLDK